MLIKSATFTLGAIAFVVASTTAANAEAYTTRIEPRPFYGAVVTLEEGVRVIRPLPPERHVIINPGNATPLSLGFNETNVYENRTIRNYNYSESGGSSSGTATYSGRAGFYGPGFATGGYGYGAGRQGGQGAAIGRGGRGHHGGHH